MKKIEIKVCYGTMCYVMGGSHLEMLQEEIPQELKDKVTISGATCLGLCDKSEFGKPPFVMVGKEIVNEATINKVINTIKKVVK